MLPQTSITDHTPRKPDNIALGKYSDEPPSFEEVTNAAKLAGAHEFILDLPDGYDTVYEGTSVQLSGGQMQVNVHVFSISLRFCWFNTQTFLDHSELR